MALVRIKRRREEDPVESLLIACKKQRTNDLSFSTIFKFTATVEDKDKDLKTHVNTAKQIYSSAERNALLKERQVVDIKEKIRAENILKSENNRFKVISCIRHAGDDQELEDELTIVDIVNSPKDTLKDSEKEQPLSTEEQYVYDLYYAKEGDFDDLMLETIASVHAIDETLFDYGNNDSDDDALNKDPFMDEDSNDENNWRNDYPEDESGSSNGEDSDEDDSIRLNKMIRSLNRFKLGGEYETDLSSDREDEALIYGSERGEFYHSDYYGTDSD